CVHELCCVLLVPVPARVGECAEETLCVRVLLRRLAVELLTDRTRKPPPPTGENLIGSVGLAFAVRAQKDANAGSAILLPRRRLRDERHEGAGVGALDPARAHI